MAYNKPLKILIADDDEEDRFLIMSALNKNDIKNKIQTVEDGEALLEYLCNTGKYTDSKKYSLPDLIFLDLNMPKKNGIEALAEIRSNERLKHIPIIVLSTSQAEQDILNSYKFGVNSFITKPVTFEDLIEITTVIEKYWFQTVKLPYHNHEK